MQVQLVTATTSGGAGRATCRLKHALTPLGAEVTLSVQRKSAGADVILNGSRMPWWASAGLSRLITHLDRSGPIQSLNVFRTGRVKDINSGSADLVNLHWIGSDTLSISELGQINKPWVWTLHDMWAFCGTEHVASDDMQARWRNGYHKRQGLIDINAWMWRHKKAHFPEEGFAICPSQWLTQCVKDSPLMSKWRVETIPNPIDVDQFVPRDKLACRAQLGLLGHERILLFGAQNAQHDANKGFDLLQETLARVANFKDGSANLRCLIFGNEKPGPPTFNGIPATYLGKLNSDQAIITAYGASDLVIVPSRIENLPQIATEAQSCGRPVFGFETSGLKDAVEQDITGRLSPAFDTEQAAVALWELICSPSSLLTLGQNARARALKLWSPKVVGQQYLDFYEEILSLGQMGSSNRV